MNPEKEIQKIGEFYRASESKEAKEYYIRFVDFLILDSPEKDRSKLEKMWEWEIE